VEPETTVYTDEARAYEGMDDYAHKSVNHPVSEFVDGMARVNDVENSRALFRPDITGRSATYPRNVSGVTSASS